MCCMVSELGLNMWPVYIFGLSFDKVMFVLSTQ